MFELHTFELPDPADTAPASARFPQAPLRPRGSDYLHPKAGKRNTTGRPASGAERKVVKGWRVFLFMEEYEDGHSNDFRTFEEAMRQRLFEGCQTQLGGVDEGRKTAA